MHFTFFLAIHIFLNTFIASRHIYVYVSSRMTKSTVAETRASRYAPNLLHIINDTVLTPTSSDMSGLTSNSTALGEDFGKLPAELRNEVYRMSLVTADSCISIARSRSKNPAFGALGRYGNPKPTTTLIVPKGTISIEGEKSKVDFAPARVLATGLLRASKCINEEATPILYGLNNFEFCYRSAAQDFLKRYATKLLWSLE